jgi:hypothetical protein
MVLKGEGGPSSRVAITVYSHRVRCARIQLAAIGTCLLVLSFQHHLWCPAASPVANTPSFATPPALPPSRRGMWRTTRSAPV